MGGPGCASTWSLALQGSIFAPDRGIQILPFVSHLLSEGERKGKRMCFSHYGYKTETHASPPPAPESAALRGALTPACILINIIPPSINSKSTYFTPGEKNNPRLVSPASPGAAEGLNPPHPCFLLPPSPWGLLTGGGAAACLGDGFGIRRWQHGNMARLAGVH